MRLNPGSCAPADAQRGERGERKRTSLRPPETRPRSWLLPASLVDGCWWLSGRIRRRPWEYHDDFGALHSDVHWQREAVPECDDARPKRGAPWEYRGRAVKRVNLAPSSRDVPVLAALLLHQLRARSDWEGGILGIKAAHVLLQTGLDLRSVVTAAAAGEGITGGERDAPVDLPIVGRSLGE